MIAPWAVTELVVTTAVRQNPDPILEFVASEERQAAREAIHGRWWRGGRRDSDSFWEPEDCALAADGIRCQEYLAAASFGSSGTTIRSSSSDRTKSKRSSPMAIRKDGFPSSRSPKPYPRRSRSSAIAGYAQCA
jgi:hypothetical protein